MYGGRGVDGAWFAVATGVEAAGAPEMFPPILLDPLLLKSRKTRRLRHLLEPSQRISGPRDRAFRLTSFLGAGSNRLCLRRWFPSENTASAQHVRLVELACHDFLQAGTGDIALDLA